MSSPFKRSLRALCLALLLSLPLVAAHLPAPPLSLAAPSTLQRYETAKSDMERLRGDAKRSSWREPWQKLAREFQDIYETGKDWNNRPAALYRSGIALEEMARRSAVRRDARAALAVYEQLAKAHPASVLADDALFRAARIKAELLKDPAGARALLKRIRSEYPSGDMAAEADRYGKARDGKAPRADAAKNDRTEQESTGRSPKKQTVSRRDAATLKQVAWQSRRNLVKITLNFDRPVAWTVRSQPANPKTGSPIRLLVDVAGATPDPKIRPGVKIADSMLTRMRLDLSSPGHTRMLLDFSALKRFSVSTASSPFRLIITAARTDGALPGGVPLGRFLQSEEPVKPASAMLPSNIAKQLGLSVSSVIIDAGHGGKDPGTSHNGIVEREVTLDLAKRVGSLLAARGLKVHYTRTNNTWISLEARSRKANQVKADLFVSIHVNASPNRNTSGFETYFLNFASSSEAAKLAGVENAMSDRKLGELEGLLADLMLGARTQESRRLAGSIQNTALARLKKKGYEVRNGGTKSAPFHVLLGSGMPGVLVEVGYCTNRREARRLGTKAYRAALADGIASGVLAYAGKLAN